MKSPATSHTAPPERTAADDPTVTLAQHEVALAEAEHELEALPTEIRAAGLTPPEELVQRRVAAHYRLADLRTLLPALEDEAKNWQHEQACAAAQGLWKPLVDQKRALYADLEAAVQQIVSLCGDLHALQEQQVSLLDKAARLSRANGNTWQQDHLAGVPDRLSQQILTRLRPVLQNVISWNAVNYAPPLPTFVSVDEVGTREQLIKH
jgi:hypothetical protein